MIKDIQEKINLHAVLLLLIVLVAAVNRFYGLDRLSMWSDELWVVTWSSKGSLSDMFSFVIYNDNHPPGHYFFTRYWQMLAGDSDFAIRFPFAVTGIFLVYSTYVIGKQHYSTEAGLVAAALVSSSWQAIYYSQEARANIMVAVVALWCLHYFYQLVFTGKTDKKNLAAFWITATLCCYLHYVGMVFVACLVLIFGGVLLLRRQKACVVLGAKLFLPVVLLYSPWMYGLFYHLTHKPPGAWWQTPEWSYLYENFKWIFGFGSKILVLYQMAAFMLLACLGLSILQSNKLNLPLANILGVTVEKYIHIIKFSSLLLLMIVTPVMVFFIKSRISQPVFDYRHFVYTIALLAMPAGFLVSLLLVRFGGMVKNSLLVIILFLLILNQNYYNILGKLYKGYHFKPEYRQSVDLLVHNQSKNPETILVITNSQFYGHYLRRNFNGRTADYLLMAPQAVSNVTQLLADKHTSLFYFLEAPERGGNGMISLTDMELAKIYTPLCRTHFVYTQVIKFSTEKPLAVDWDQVPDCIQD